MGMCRTCSPLVTLDCAKLQKTNPITPTPHKSKQKQQGSLRKIRVLQLHSGDAGNCTCNIPKTYALLSTCGRSKWCREETPWPEFGVHPNICSDSCPTLAHVFWPTKQSGFAPVRGFSQSSPNLSNPNKTYRPSFCPYSSNGSLNH